MTIYACYIKEMIQIVIMKELIKSEAKTCGVEGRKFYLVRYIRNSDYSLIFQLL